MNTRTWVLLSLGSCTVAAVAVLIAVATGNLQLGAHVQPFPLVRADQPIEDHPSADFDEAVKMYRAGQYAGAYGRFARAADLEGHHEAARIALFMVRYGSQLYGQGWGASEDQIDHWTWLVSQRQAPPPAEAGD